MILEYSQPFCALHISVGFDKHQCNLAICKISHSQIFLSTKILFNRPINSFCRFKPLLIYNESVQAFSYKLWQFSARQYQDYITVVVVVDLKRRYRNIRNEWMNVVVLTHVSHLLNHLKALLCLLSCKTIPQVHNSCTICCFTFLQ